MEGTVLLISYSPISHFPSIHSISECTCDLDNTRKSYFVYTTPGKVRRYRSVCMCKHSHCAHVCLNLAKRIAEIQAPSHLNKTLLLLLLLPHPHMYLGTVIYEKKEADSLPVRCDSRDYSPHISPHLAAELHR